MINHIEFKKAVGTTRNRNQSGECAPIVSRIWCNGIRIGWVIRESSWFTAEWALTANAKTSRYDHYYANSDLKRLERSVRYQISHAIKNAVNLAAVAQEDIS